MNGKVTILGPCFGIQGMILGGTELPLMLRDSYGGDVPFLDTTKIHVDRYFRKNTFKHPINTVGGNI